MGSKISEYQYDRQGTEGKWFLNEKYCWWNPKVGSAAASFCTDSSLHGLKYLGQRDRHLSERILWGLVLCISIVASAYFINTVYENYNRNPVIVVFNSKETAIEEMPFPAVTVCNINNIQKSKAEEYFRDARGQLSSQTTLKAQRNLYYLDHICSSTPAFSRKFNYSLTQTSVDPYLLRGANISKNDGRRGDISKFFEDASQNCSQLIRLCSWRGVIYPCHELFQGILTDYGFCCVFNMVPQSLLHRFRNDSRDSEEVIRSWETWDVKNHGLFLKKIKKGNPNWQKLAGKSSGLSILLDPDIEEYFCTNSDSFGFQVAIHLPSEVPKIVDKAIAIKTNSEVFVDMRPEIFTADESVLGFPLNKRKCYDKEEFPLFFYTYYTASNCIDECIANQCDCVRYYMPRDDNRGLCRNDKHECTENVQRMFFKWGADKYCNYCLPSCQEIRYYGETTAIPIQNSYNIWENENGSAQWSGKNVSIVHIFFGSGRTYSRLRSELYGTVDLIANTGGLLGLCLGFSGISLIEIIYFVTLRAYCASKRRKGASDKSCNELLHSGNSWAKRIMSSDIIGNFQKSHYGNNSQGMFNPDAKNVSYWSSNTATGKQGHIVIDLKSFVQ